MAKNEMDNKKLAQMWSELSSERQKRRRNIYYLIYVLIAVISIGVLGFHYFDTLTWLDALYLSVITITTIGYGDIVPSTPEAKIFTMVYALVGVGAAFYLLTNIASYVLEKREETFFTRLTGINNAGQKAQNFGKNIFGKTHYHKNDILQSADIDDSKESSTKK